MDDQSLIGHHHHSRTPSSQGRIGSGGGRGRATRPSLGPVAQAFDGFGHGHRQRHGVGHDIGQILLRGFSVRGKGPVQGYHPGGFDFSSGMLFAGVGQPHRILVLRSAAVFGDHQVPDRDALPDGGQPGLDRAGLTAARDQNRESSPQTVRGFGSKPERSEPKIRGLSTTASSDV